MTGFGRVLTAMVTPFDSDGSVNYAVAEALASYLADHGSDGIVVCGTTGESPTLTWDEQYQLFKTVQHAVSGKAKVIAGTGSNSTSEAIEATKKANRLGLDGSLQVVPYYNKPPQEGLCRHFGAIARAVPDLPLMLYNIPGRTGQSLSVESVTYLSSNYPNVVAIKEATGSIDFASQIRGGTPDNFAIYSGDDSLTLPLLAVGGAGPGVAAVAAAAGAGGKRELEEIGRGRGRGQDLVARVEGVVAGEETAVGGQEAPAVRWAEEPGPGVGRHPGRHSRGHGVGAGAGVGGDGGGGPIGQGERDRGPRRSGPVAAGAVGVKVIVEGRRQGDRRGLDLALEARFGAAQRAVDICLQVPIHQSGLELDQRQEHPGVEAGVAAPQLDEASVVG